MVQANLTYDEQVTAYSAQGLMNRIAMKVFFNIGKMNFTGTRLTYSGKMSWKSLVKRGSQRFPNLCALVSTAASTNAVAGFVVYQGDSKENHAGTASAQR